MRILIPQFYNAEENKVFLKALEENKVEDSGTGGTEFWDQSHMELGNAISTDVCSLQ